MKKVTYKGGPVRILWDVDAARRRKVKHGDTIEVSGRAAKELLARPGDDWVEADSPAPRPVRTPKKGD